jgi:apolipoprotein D and lipocalin family protein
MKKTILLAISASLLISSLSSASFNFWGPKPPETVDHVDLSRYVGTWHEIARFPMSQQNGCFAVKATYTQRGDGRIDVKNECNIGGFDGPLEVANGVAKVADTETNSKLKVKFSFFMPWAPYWIIDLAPDYSYAVVGTPDRKFLWILSRTPKMDYNTYGKILVKVVEQGFNPARLVETPQ